MFPASSRLTKKDFTTTIFKIVYRGVYFDISKNKEKSSYKVACVISKKTIPRAVIRNKIRRRVLHSLRECFLTKEIPDSYIIIYPKKTITTIPVKLLQEELCKAFNTL